MIFKRFLAILMIALASTNANAQKFMANIGGRDVLSLNGSWDMIIDWYDKGGSRGIFMDMPPLKKTGFNEYSFEKKVLKVPGDWNSQYPELKYYEGSIWYRKMFVHQPVNGKRYFLHFGAVNYLAEVYLNGVKLGEHEGGFTPFQFEVTNLLKRGNNKLVVKANNERREDGIPSLSFDWWNYGGITRDVSLIQTATDYIDDYFLQLKKGSMDEVEGWVQLSAHSAQRVYVELPEAGIACDVLTDTSGYAKIAFKAALKLWAPQSPMLYQVRVSSGGQTLTEKIGFRCIEVKGTDILLNGKPVFLKGISFHEEIPQQMRRAASASDAEKLLRSAKELGCNFVRLAHYPQNEHIVRMAEEMGLMLWEEIPVWQGIQFNNPLILWKAERMLHEMVSRDKNRCGIIIWSLSNETAPSPDRNRVLADMAGVCRAIDPTRLVSSAFDHFSYSENKIIIDDPLSNALDIIAVNKYMGWYAPWPAAAGDVEWESKFEKPMVITEFGGEAKYGNHGSSDRADRWNEEYQEKLYLDNIKMFEKITFLRGVCPWVLADFRSPFRMQSSFQDGWNRKGLLSEKGKKKKAWYVMHDYYKRQIRF